MSVKKKVNSIKRTSPLKPFLEIEPRYYSLLNDVAFKKIAINHEDTTISFLNSILKRECNRRFTKVVFVPTECLPRDKKAKYSTLDVLIHRSKRM
jgi:hypothetical protein